MEDFYDNEKTKAFVYLSSAGDKDNMLLISDEHLHVIFRKKKHVYQLSMLKLLKTEKVKLLFPLVTGGIITPFAFLSFFIDPYYPWLHLSAMLLGMFLFYLGFSGKDSFTLVNKRGEEIRHYVSGVSVNLNAFIDFVNPLLSPEAASVQGLYFIIGKKEEKILFGESEDGKAFFPLSGYTYSQFEQYKRHHDKGSYFCIDPGKALREITFQYDLSDNMMRPVLGGPVPRGSLLKTGSLALKVS